MSLTHPITEYECPACEKRSIKPRGNGINACQERGDVYCADCNTKYLEHELDHVGDETEYGPRSGTAGEIVGLLDDDTETDVVGLFDNSVETKIITPDESSSASAANSDD